MKEREELVLYNIYALIRDRRLAHRFPDCVLRMEVMNMFRTIRESVIDGIIEKLISDGWIEAHPVQNDTSYYLTKKFDSYYVKGNSICDR